MHFCKKHDRSHKAKCPECRAEAKKEFLDRHPTNKMLIEKISQLEAKL